MAEVTAELYESLRTKAVGCMRCRLSADRTNVVWMDGPTSARLLIVGEAPGQQEDEQGIPFVGPSGVMVNRLLSLVGLRRENVAITNVVKCRPPENRDPLPDEVETCGIFLRAQIIYMKPTTILTLGAPALHFFMDASISRVRGHLLRVTPSYMSTEFNLVSTYHPGAILHSADQNLRDQIFRMMMTDFRIAAHSLH